MRVLQLSQPACRILFKLASREFEPILATKVLRCRLETEEFLQAIQTRYSQLPTRQSWGRTCENRESTLVLYSSDWRHMGYSCACRKCRALLLLRGLPLWLQNFARLQFCHQALMTSAVCFLASSPCAQSLDYASIEVLWRAASCSAWYQPWECKSVYLWIRGVFLQANTHRTQAQCFEWCAIFSQSSRRSQEVAPRWDNLWAYWGLRTHVRLCFQLSLSSLVQLFSHGSCLALQKRTLFGNSL